MGARKNVLGPNLSVSYQRPLKVVRGWKLYLYDRPGAAYLDVYNTFRSWDTVIPRVARRGSAALGLPEHQYALSSRQRDPVAEAASGASA